MEPPEGLRGLRRRHLSAGADDGAGLQRAALPAVCAGQRVAGLLGLHRQQQCAAAGVAGAGAVLLQPLWLGLGQFCGRNQHRQGPEGPPLDEADF